MPITMRRLLCVFLCSIAAPSLVRAAGLPEAKPDAVGMDPHQLARLDGLIRQAVAEGKAPGAVCVVGHKGRIVYRKAFGSRDL